MYSGYVSNPSYLTDSTRLEVVTTCVGFDDFLDVSLSHNMSQVDTMIVVTSPEDKKTQLVAQKHGAICVQTDLFKKNGRSFNKGAAINAGFGYFQYFGWRLVLDSDIVLPNNFRRILFNQTHLDPMAVYGADRVDVIGNQEIDSLKDKKQHHSGYVIHSDHHRPPSGRYVDGLYGYVPIGFFQLFNAQSHKSYPYSLGTAAHDDVLFATQWPGNKRHLLTNAYVYHICGNAPSVGENWDGKRRQKRID